MSISRLLVVDDDDEMRDMMTEYLRKHGFMALGAASLAGIEAAPERRGDLGEIETAMSPVAAVAPLELPAAHQLGDPALGEIQDAGQFRRGQLPCHAFLSEAPAQPRPIAALHPLAKSDPR